jgi:hypothetical protein
MDEEVSVKVTVTVQGQAKSQNGPLSTSLNLQKIYEQIIERAEDAKEQSKQEVNPETLLRFLIAVEAVEKLENLKTGGGIEFILPQAVAGLLVGEQILKLTGSTGVVSNQQANTANKISQYNQDANKVCVKVVVVNATSVNNTLEIDGEFYDNKWRPWWRSSTSTKVGREWKIPLPKEWENSPPSHDTLDPDNPNSKCVIFLRDILEAKTGKYICPWSGEKELLMEITKGSGKLTVTTDNSNKKKFTFDETGTGASFELLGVPTIDHLVPQSIGGENYTNNLLTVSQRANFAKGNFFPLDPKSWETRESYKVACKEVAKSSKKFVEKMRKYINESYKPQNSGGQS